MAIVRQRSLRAIAFIDTLLDTVRVTAMIFGIIICALVFSKFLALSGVATPPVGINCFVVQSVSGGRVELEDVFAGLIPYVIAAMVMLLLLCLFPQIALFLPSTMK